MIKPQGLYWESGPFSYGIEGPEILLRNGEAEATAFLGEFVSACQKHYFAFQSAAFGIQKQRELFSRLFRPEHRDKTLFIGQGRPDEEQTLGRSAVGRIRQGELIDSLSVGGNFENYHAKALVVIIYQQWEEYYRPRIAEAVSINARQVKCRLMGDIRLVRNLIIHEKSIVPENFSGGLEFLPLIWNLAPGELRITHDMVHSWMEQLNSMLVMVDYP